LKTNTFPSLHLFLKSSAVRDEMILYHFTDFYNLDHPEDGRTILKEGLKPNGKKGMPPLDAVWFTTQADPEFMFAREDGPRYRLEKTQRSNKGRDPFHRQAVDEVGNVATKAVGCIV
jgi:hypothetical protein